MGRRTWDHDAKTEHDAGPRGQQAQGRPDRLYWRAKNLSRKAKGYPEPSILLPDDATTEEIEALCETYTARLEAWLEYGEAPRFHYDGTVAGLCDAYERHPESPIHSVRRATALGYGDSLKVIRATVGARAVAKLTPIDVKAWYRNGGAPKKPGAASGSSAPTTRSPS